MAPGRQDHRAQALPAQMRGYSEGPCRLPCHSQAQSCLRARRPRRVGIADWCAQEGKGGCACVSAYVCAHTCACVPEPMVCLRPDNDTSMDVTHADAAETPGNLSPGLTRIDQIHFFKTQKSSPRAELIHGTQDHRQPWVRVRVPFSWGRARLLCPTADPGGHRPEARPLQVRP